MKSKPKTNAEQDFSSKLQTIKTVALNLLEEFLKPLQKNRGRKKTRFYNPPLKNVTKSSKLRANIKPNNLELNVS